MKAIRITLIGLFVCLQLTVLGQRTKKATSAEVYYPGKEWQHKSANEVGVDPTLLKEAVDFAIASETKAPRDLKLNHYRSFGREPFGDPTGPIKDRGEQTGIIIKNGYVIAEWGEPWHVDMTHSVTKSFLSTVVGLTYDRGMINNIDDPVHSYIPPILPYDPMPSGNKADEIREADLIDLFGTPHNKSITWRQLLQQNSSWEGTLWGKPDWADRPSQDYAEWLSTDRNKPGTVYEYNDTRVNVLALAVLNIWRRPLPEVLKENIMDPIGASNQWRWYGYENSWIVLDGNPFNQ